MYSTARARAARAVVAFGVGLLACAGAAAGPVLFRETFDQYPDGQPPPAPWQVLEGQAVVENGRLHIRSTQQNPRVLLGQSFDGDLSVSMRLLRASGCHWSGMVVKNEYWLSVNQQYTSLLLSRRPEQVPSGVAPEQVGRQLAAGPAWQIYLWDPGDVEMRLDCEGDSLRAYLDGRRFIDVRDPTPRPGGTVMLVGGWSTDILVDEVTVTRFTPDMTPPPPPLPAAPTLNDLKAVLDRQDAIYHDGETVTLKVSWRAQDAPPLGLRFRLLDLDGKEVSTAEATIPPDAGPVAQVTLLPGRRGIFKVAMSSRGADGKETPQGDLISFAVIPAALAERPANEASAFGGHPHWEVPEFHYALARKIGMRWARDHDAIQYTWWNQVERERGAWRWYDDEIELLHRNQLCLLGEFLYAPAWAGTDGSATKPPRSLDDLAAYVAETVGHYRSTIRYWEVWNEPQVNTFWEGTPEQYTDLLRTAYRAAKSANPDCIVIGGGGMGLDPAGLAWAERAIKAGAMAHCDRFSVHYGNSGKAIENERRQFIEALGHLREMMRQNGGEKPIWNSETAVMTTSFLDPYRVGVAEPDAVYHYREAAFALVRMLVLNLACGVEKVFYYDVVWPRRDAFIEGFLKNPVNTGMLELHGGLKPLGVAYATAADVLDGARFAETVDLAPDAHAYLFQRGPDCSAVYWGNFGRTWTEKRLRLRATGPWEWSDVMNVRGQFRASGQAELPFTRAPAFVIAAGTPFAEFRRAWQDAVVE